MADIRRWWSLILHGKTMKDGAPSYSLIPKHRRSSALGFRGVTIFLLASAAALAYRCRAGNELDTNPTLEEIQMSEVKGKFVWYDLMTSDISAAATFYDKVVGWTSMDAGMPDRPYHIFSVGKTMVAGLMPAFT